MTTLTPVWLDNKVRRQVDTYRPGQVMERWDATASRMQRYTVERVTARSRTITLRDAQGQQQVSKISALDSGWRLYDVGSQAVAPGERLQWLARQGKLNARDVVTVEAITRNVIMVRHDDGRRVRIPLADGIKATQGYVTTPGAQMNTDTRVLAAVSGRDTQAALLNTLARSGRQVTLYTPLADEEAMQRLARSPLYRQAREQVSPHGQPLAEAIQQAKASLMPLAEKAVRQAISLAQGSEVTFPRLLVTANALRAHPNMTPAMVDKVFRQWVNRGEVLPVPGARGKSQQVYVPAETYAQEKAIIRTLAEGKATQTPLMSVSDPTLFAGLTPGQQAATRLILDSTDRFVGIQGYAGVGKTTQFRAVLNALETLPMARRPTVIGLAPTHRAVSEMKSVGVASQTIAAFLMDIERRQQGGEKIDFSQTLFLVDESSMVGNRDMAQTLQVIAAHQGRAVLSGDSQQLMPVANGAPFSLMQQRSALDMAIMNDIVRQTPALRPAVYALLARQTDEALTIIASVTPDQVPRVAGAFVPPSSVFQCQPPQATEPQTPQSRQTVSSSSLHRFQSSEHQDIAGNVISAIVADYAGRTEAARQQTLIVTQTNADSRAINAGIHAALRQQGQIGDRETVITTLVREKTHPEALKSVEGWRQHAGDIALINQRYYTIESVPEVRDGVVTLRDSDGQPHLLSAFESSLRDIAIFSRQSMALSEGDRVRFAHLNRDLGRDTQTVWTVAAIAHNGDITLTQGEQQRVISPGKHDEDQHLDYAYAGTAHKAQGASETYVIALAGVSGGRRALAGLSDAYVALSRMKAHVQVYTDDVAGWQASVARSRQRQTAHDVLSVEQDRRQKTGLQLWESAQALEGSALGRALLRESGLPEQGEGRFVGGSKKYPSPHVAWPAYDNQGKQQGVWLSEVRLSAEGHIRGIATEGRLLGADSANLIVVQRSQDGTSHLTDNPSDALNLAAKHPGQGVIYQREDGPLPDWLLGTLTQGIPERTLPTESEKPVAEPMDFRTPAERAQAEVERAARLLQQQEKQMTPPERDTTPHESEREIARQYRDEQSLAERDEQRRVARQAEQLLAADRQQMAEQQRQQDQLRQMEKEIVKEKTL
ncbi:AAA family ATPase (plasmid) [Edwardsiella tarda]|uniref:AAA family ATPase n=1 Tax=Edwardsiella tarda TaxID=636 RepID=UPI001D049A84|nr:conjugative transfer relaxase/helicase TraI domain-containing protein [Edwardsiella tarda]UCQ29581.1 AAA family ATPase [Edwardsiella tarda]